MHSTKKTEKLSIIFYSYKLNYKFIWFKICLPLGFNYKVGLKLIYIVLEAIRDLYKLCTFKYEIIIITDQ